MTFNVLLRAVYALLGYGLALWVLRMAVNGFSIGLAAGFALAATYFVNTAWQVADGVKKPTSTVFLTLVLLLAAAGIGTIRSMNSRQSFNYRILGNTTQKGTRGHLGAIRSALSIYYGDLEGQYPATLEALTIGGKYLTTIPEADTGAHGASGKVFPVTGAEAAAQAFGDTGGWYYVTDGQLRGNVGVNCTHTDLLGKNWYGY